MGNTGSLKKSIYRLSKLPVQCPLSNHFLVKATMKDYLSVKLSRWSTLKRTSDIRTVKLRLKGRDNAPLYLSWNSI